MFFLTEDLLFPPVDLTDEDGMLAIGGDLSIERLLLAYQNGIFPWYSEGEIIQWWCPDPRFVLFPEELIIKKSMRPLLNRDAFTFTTNTAFTEVIRQCRMIERLGQDGTWITDEVEKAYINLHQSGYAHSAEVWQDDQLVGGLYGIRLGNVFFGESMFSKVSNASRYAFIKYVQQLQQEGVQLIDCQIHTDYLETFGARMIPREEFVSLLDSLLKQ